MKCAQPAGLRPKAPYLIYLDLNKWIDLAHAASGTEKGRNMEADLSTATELVREGTVLFPLSAAHFMEVAKIGNPTQRRTLARLMVTLSKGWFLSSPSSLIQYELRRAFASRLDMQVAPDIPPSALTRSIKEVFVDPEIFGGDEAAIAWLSESPMMLEEFLATARAGKEFLDNWRRYASQHEQDRILRRDTTRELRKRAYCVMVTMAIQDRLHKAFAEFGLTTLSVLEHLGTEGNIDLLEAVPFLNVEINLFVERNEHHDRMIQSNDELDIGFLSIAIPYCHAVVTEKFWTSLVRRLRLDRKYSTHICTGLAEALSGVESNTKI